MVEQECESLKHILASLDNLDGVDMLSLTLTRVLKSQKLNLSMLILMRRKCVSASRMDLAKLLRNQRTRKSLSKEKEEHLIQRYRYREL